MKTKSLIIKHFYLLSIIIFLISGCEKEEKLYPEPKNQSRVPEEITLAEKNEMIENYAYILATSMYDNELRSTIKQEAQVKFDGDYDILSSNLESIVMARKDIPVKEFLLSSANSRNCPLKSTTNKNKDLADNKFFNAVRKTIPNLQVSVPVHCDEWDTKNYVPLVAFLPSDYDERTTDSVVAFDSYGKKHLLSTAEEPAKPVLVVSISERVDQNGTKIGTTDEYMKFMPNTTIQPVTTLKSEPSGPKNLTISHGPARTIILQWTDVEDETGYEVWRMLQPNETHFYNLAKTIRNDNGFVNGNIAVGTKVWYKVRALNNDGYSSWSPIMATTVSPRNDGEWLKIKRMKFSKSALRAVESWVSGAPELRLRIVQGSENGASTVFTSGRMEPARRKDIADTWWNKEIPLFSWSTNTYGTVLTFDWQEEDNISKMEFTVSASYEAKALGGKIKVGGNVKFTVDKNGSIGNTSVMWWHNKDQIYDLSGFQWQFVY
jgi:hypothetical protein